MTGPDLQNDSIRARLRRLRDEFRANQREAGVEGEELNLFLAMMTFVIPLVAFAAITPNTTSTGEQNALHSHD